jgi:hypothetical protein
LSAQSRAVLLFKLLLPKQLSGAAPIASAEQPAIINGFNLGEPNQLFVKPHSQGSTVVGHHALPSLRAEILIRSCYRWEAKTLPTAKNGSAVAGKSHSLATERWYRKTDSLGVFSCPERPLLHLPMTFNLPIGSGRAHMATTQRIERDKALCPCVRYLRDYLPFFSRDNLTITEDGACGLSAKPLNWKGFNPQNLFSSLIWKRNIFGNKLSESGTSPKKLMRSPRAAF